MAVGPVMLSREPDYHISRGPSSLDCFNVILAELGTLLTAEQGPQDLDTLARLLADEQRELASEWPAAQRTRSPGWTVGGFGSSIRPLRSRPLSSAMTASGTRAGARPSSTMRTTPGDQRAACHCSVINTKA